MPEENEMNSSKEIIKVLGSCNCIVILPDGFPYESRTNPLAILAESAIHVLDSYGVINTRYKQSIVNLMSLQQISQHKRITHDFLGPIRKFKEEIKENGQTPLLVILHACPESEFAIAGHPGTNLLIGIGQGERNNPDHPPRPTFAPSISTKFRVSLADHGFSNELAPPTSPFCGHDSDSLNQFFFRKDLHENTSDSDVLSIVLTFNTSYFEENPDALPDNGYSLGQAIHSFTQKMPIVRKVKISSIDTTTAKDKNYIFRIHNDSDPSDGMLREAYIDELAQSIKRSGLLHPLVLLQKNDGNYKILCGFRRFQALSRLDVGWVEAKIYQEGDFSQEDFFDISLAENTKRRNLNPIEIGNFLESAARNLDMNNTRLAEKFGQTLGIGRPNQNVSQSTIHKYRKVYEIYTTGESKEIINDIINENLQFTIAAEILAPIKNPGDRNSFYTQIIKRLNPTRPQIIEIKKILEELSPKLKTTLEKEEIQAAIQKALPAEEKGSAFLRHLRKRPSRSGPTAETEFESRVAEIRNALFGDNSCKNDFIISKQGKRKKGEITIQLKIRKETLADTLMKLKRLSDFSESISRLFVSKKG